MGKKAPWGFLRGPWPRAPFCILDSQEGPRWAGAGRAFLCPWGEVTLHVWEIGSGGALGQPWV